MDALNLEIGSFYEISDNESIVDVMEESKAEKVVFSHLEESLLKEGGKPPLYPRCSRGGMSGQEKTDKKVFLSARVPSSVSLPVLLKEEELRQGAIAAIMQMDPGKNRERLEQLSLAVLVCEKDIVSEKEEVIRSIMQMDPGRNRKDFSGRTLASLLEEQVDLEEDSYGGVSESNEFSDFDKNQEMRALASVQKWLSGIGGGTA